jgi:hypothetical protein
MREDVSSWYCASPENVVSKFLCPRWDAAMACLAVKAKSRNVRESVRTGSQNASRLAVRSSPFAVPSLRLGGCQSKETDWTYGTHETYGNLIRTTPTV